MALYNQKTGIQQRKGSRAVVPWAWAAPVLLKWTQTVLGARGGVHAAAPAVPKPPRRHARSAPKLPIAFILRVAELWGASFLKGHVARMPCQ